MLDQEVLALDRGLIASRRYLPRVELHRVLPFEIGIQQICLVLGFRRTVSVVKEVRGSH
jgi:hypothetical protein